MRLLHLSDTHLHAAGASTHYPHIDTRARLGTVLAAATAHGVVDLIALTGDICDDGSPAGAAATRDVLGAAYPQVPILAAPGNHDLTEVVTEVFGVAPSTVGTWRLVVAATNVPRQIEGDAAGSLAALADLDADDPRPLLLLQHHPIRSRSTHPWFVLRGAELLQARLREFVAPVVVLTGHTHEAFEDRDGRIHHVGAPSTYYPIHHEGEDWSVADSGTGALLVDLADDGSVALAPVWA